MKGRRGIVALHLLLAVALAMLSLLCVRAWNGKHILSLLFLLLGLGASMFSMLQLARREEGCFPTDVSLLALAWLWIGVILLLDLLPGRAPGLSTGAFFLLQALCLLLCAMVALLLLTLRARVKRRSRSLRDAQKERQFLSAELERARSKLTSARIPSQCAVLALLDGLLEEMRFAEVAVGTDVSDLDERIRVRSAALTKEIENWLDIGAEDISGLEADAHAIRELIEERNRQLRLLRGNESEG